MSETCPWKIHWGVGQESTTQCDKLAHAGEVTITRGPDNRFSVETEGSPDHSGPSGFVPGQRITWQAGDRREYTGDWPGPCMKLFPSSEPCILHVGHHGRCAP
jgi:hypothetical protein